MTHPPSPPFREGSELPPVKTAICYNGGGLGDWINWTSAISHAIEKHPHTHGYVVAQRHFSELAQLWLKKYEPRFKVLTVAVSDFGDIPEIRDHYHICPGIGQYANTCGVWIFRLGFIYYCQTSEIPKGAHLPEIRGDEADLTHFLLPSNYAVITPYATTPVKRLKGESLNQLLSWLQKEGITPVILGKRDTAPDHPSAPPPGLDLRGCLDLTGKTTLTEAACIMARARFVLGADNGLLHLASCSSVTVIVAFTTVKPEMTLGPRKKGKTLTLTPPESLTCRFCQNQMRYLPTLDFKRCLYGDNLCTETFDGETLIRAARKVLHEG